MFFIWDYLLTISYLSVKIKLICQVISKLDVLLNAIWCAEQCNELFCSIWSYRSWCSISCSLSWQSKYLLIQYSIILFTIFFSLYIHFFKYKILQKWILKQFKIFHNIFFWCIFSFRCSFCSTYSLFILFIIQCECVEFLSDTGW